MGTKVQCESYFPGYFSMRDLNEDSNSCSWPLYYNDKAFTNGQYYTGYINRSIADAYTSYDKDVLKQTMLEHEATFKKQLYELHRLYRKQKDMMDEIKSTELHKGQTTVETSFASSPLASQITSEDARKWHMSSFPFANPVYARLSSASGIEDIHSPLSSMKGDSKQPSPLQSQNGVISKDLAVLDSRPSKVRRKMFDLHLPADEYIDTEEEELRDENVFGISRYLPNGSHKILPGNGTNFFLGNGGKNNFQGDSSKSASCLRSTSNVTDLNEPINVEEIKNPVYVDCMGSTRNGEIRVREIDAKPKSQFLDFPKEISLNPHHGSANGSFISTHLQYSPSGKQGFPCMLEAGQNNNNLQPVSQCQPEKMPTSSQSMQILLNKTHESSTLFLTDENKIKQLRETKIHGLDLCEKKREISNNNHPDSSVTSHFQSPYPAPPELGRTWSHSALSWEKANGLIQKLSTGHTHPYLNSSATLSRNSQSSNQSHGILGERWNYNSNSACNPSFGSEMLVRNGFYHGSSSGSKELLVSAPLGSYHYLNGSVADNLNSEHTNNHSSPKCFESSNCMEPKAAKDGNFNMRSSICSSNEAAAYHGIQVIDLERKQEEHLVGLPWLRAKPACKNEVPDIRMDSNNGELGFLESSLNQLSGKAEPAGCPIQMAMQNAKAASCVKLEASRTEINDSGSCRKILGVPIFEKEKIVKNESFLTSPSVSLPVPSKREVENSRKNRILDINLPCDPAVPDLGQQLATEVDLNVCRSRHLFDLNSCVSEDEVCLMPSVPNSKAKFVGIDLEAPASPDAEGDGIPMDERPGKAHEELLQEPPLKDGSPQEELDRVAAEAIVAMSLIGQNLVEDAISNSPEASMIDPLDWFVEIATSCQEDLENKLEAFPRANNGEDNESSSSEEIDYFESMTLKLPETAEEDYMPKPLVPETLKLEEPDSSPLPTRTRRGQARRGRQRRDFQRDILPGLASLSRHEVTEDIQTFGGLMRATGHSWHSGLMRRNSTRNGCARGRRRAQVSPAPVVTATIPSPPLVQQVNTIEVLALEDRSLTGWGKTTRRPRRQRCPAGNPPPIALT